MPGAETERSTAAHQDMAARERGVAAKLHLDRGREPAQRIVSVRIIGQRNGEGRFRQVVFSRDRLKRGIVQPTAERHHGGGIAGEWRVGEGIDLGEGEHSHQWGPLISDAMMVARDAGGQGQRADSGLGGRCASLWLCAVRHVDGRCQSLQA